MPPSGTNQIKRRLGVNIDHIATLRQVRGISEPDPVAALPILAACQVDQVTCHLREDRRHMRDDDVMRLQVSGILPLNLEMALTKEMIDIARRVKPKSVTLVPERHEELTTEGGLNVQADPRALRDGIRGLKEVGIWVSLFIDPDPKIVALARELGADSVELHTGSYCEAHGTPNEQHEFTRLCESASQSGSLNLPVYAGHGLNARNLRSICTIFEIEEYNIGHSLIGRAVFVGLEAAVRELQTILSQD